MLSLMDAVKLFQEHTWGITVGGKVIKNVSYEQLRIIKYKADTLRPTEEVIKSRFTTCLDYALAIEKLCGGKLYRVKNHSHVFVLVYDVFTDFGGVNVNIFTKEELLCGMNYKNRLIELQGKPKHRNDVFK